MHGVKVFAIFGGQPIFKQIEGLKTKPQIIVGTPGRIIDHIERRTLRLENVKMLVLDEADEMLKMGFREDIEAITQKLAGKRQGVLASATMSADIKNLTKGFLTNPVTIDAGDSNSPAKSIKQEYIAVSPKHKKEMLIDILSKLNGTALVFCNTKKMTTDLYEHLNANKITASEIHGDMRQNERTRAMNAFKSGSAKILVATDVAARGIDVNNITYVINYDYPEMEEYYIHRIGRTGRAGNEGLAYTFITTSNQMANLNALSKRLGFDIVNSPLSGTMKFETTGSTDVSRRRGPQKNTRSTSSRPYGKTDGFKSQNNRNSYAKKDDKSYSKPYNNKRSAKFDDANAEKPNTSEFARTTRRTNIATDTEFSKGSKSSKNKYGKTTSYRGENAVSSKTNYKNKEDRYMEDKKLPPNLKKEGSGFEKFMEKKNSQRGASSFKGNQNFRNVKNNQSTRVRPSGNKV
jgi:superfamily II DNA/RNA helicase